MWGPGDGGRDEAGLAAMVVVLRAEYPPSHSPLMPLLRQLVVVPFRQFITSTQSPRPLRPPSP